MVLVRYPYRVLDSTCAHPLMQGGITARFETECFVVGLNPDEVLSRDMYVCDPCLLVVQRPFEECVIGLLEKVSVIR